MLFTLSLGLKGEAGGCPVFFMCQEEGDLVQKTELWGSKWTLRRNGKVKEKYWEKGTLVNKLFVEIFPLLLFGRSFWAKEGTTSKVELSIAYIL